MNFLTVEVKKTHPDATIPSYGSAEAAGFDFYSVQDYTIEPGQTILVDTGISVSFEPGYKLEVVPRSGISLKTPLRVANSPGTVDSDYRGKVCVIMQNTGKETQKIFKGERIAQGIIVPIYRAHFVEVEELDSTARGEGGFGSTGTN